MGSRCVVSDLRSQLTCHVFIALFTFPFKDWLCRRLPCKTRHVSILFLCVNTFFYVWLSVTWYYSFYLYRFVRLNTCWFHPIWNFEVLLSQFTWWWFIAVENRSNTKTLITSSNLVSVGGDSLPPKTVANSRLLFDNRDQELSQTLKARYVILTLFFLHRHVID